MEVTDGQQPHDEECPAQDDHNFLEGVRAAGRLHPASATRRSRLWGECLLPPASPMCNRRLHIGALNRDRGTPRFSKQQAD